MTAPSTPAVRQVANFRTPVVYLANDSFPLRSNTKDRENYKLSLTVYNTVTSAYLGWRTRRRVFRPASRVSTYILRIGKSNLMFCKHNFPDLCYALNVNALSRGNQIAHIKYRSPRRRSSRMEFVRKLPPHGTFVFGLLHLGDAIMIKKIYIIFMIFAHFNPSMDYFCIKCKNGNIVCNIRSSC